MAAEIENDHYASAVTTAATFTGAWLRISEIHELAFQIKLTGTAAPTSTWGLDITDDLDPAAGSPLGVAAVTLPSAYTASNPAGDSANLAVNFAFGPGQSAPMPIARWCRLKLTQVSGGAASCLSIGVVGKRVRP